MAVMNMWDEQREGETRSVLDDNDEVRVTRQAEDCFVIQRFFDNSWTETAWARRTGDAWRAARTDPTIGIPSTDLSTAIAEAILQSREALNKYRGTPRGEK